MRVHESSVKVEGLALSILMDRNCPSDCPYAYTNPVTVDYCGC